MSRPPRLVRQKNENISNLMFKENISITDHCVVEYLINEQFDASLLDDAGLIESIGQYVAKKLMGRGWLIKAIQGEEVEYVIYKHCTRGTCDRDLNEKEEGVNMFTGVSSIGILGAVDFSFFISLLKLALSYCLSCCHQYASLARWSYDHGVYLKYVVQASDGRAFLKEIGVKEPFSLFESKESNGSHGNDEEVM